MVIEELGFGSAPARENGRESAERRVAAAARKAEDREKKRSRWNKRYNIPDDSER
jgi:hypothetical protein